VVIFLPMGHSAWPSPLKIQIGLSIVGAALTMFALTAWAGHRSAEEARPRVEHHLRQVDLLSQHFADLLKKDCRRFDRPDEWRTFLDGELDSATLLMAHLEQAWVEAKHTGDKDVRRAAKAPRAQVDRAQRLVTKLQACAGDNGTSFDAAAAWRRVERDVPRRQAEIALPQ
jgi:hypothetical protein